MPGAGFGGVLVFMSTFGTSGNGAVLFVVESSQPAIKRPDTTRGLIRHSNDRTINGDLRIWDPRYHAFQKRLDETVHRQSAVLPAGARMGVSTMDQISVYPIPQHFSRVRLSNFFGFSETTIGRRSTFPDRSNAPRPGHCSVPMSCGAVPRFRLLQKRHRADFGPTTSGELAAFFSRPCRTCRERRDATICSPFRHIARIMPTTQILRAPKRPSLARHR